MKITRKRRRRRMSKKKREKNIEEEGEGKIVMKSGEEEVKDEGFEYEVKNYEASSLDTRKNERKGNKIRREKSGQIEGKIHIFID